MMKKINNGKELWFDVISKGYSTRLKLAELGCMLWFDVISKGYSTVNQSTDVGRGCGLM